MKQLSLFFVIVLSLFVLPAPSVLGKDKILIYIRDDVYEDYLAFLAGRNITDINEFHGDEIRRDVVDMIIAQQALKLGGFKYEFDYAAGKVNFRNTRLLQEGKLLISFDSYWLKDAEAINDLVYISEPVIRRGEYIAGIYTSPKNEKALAVRSLDDLKNITAVSTPKWRTDWSTLEKLPLQKLVREDEWLSMARMVNIQWIDVMLMPFHSTKDQVFTLDNITLVPVPNVAVMLDDSRHFVISKKHPQGREAIEALNKGLKILRANNTITKAYTQAKFFVDVKELNILNKEIIN